jgi:hypothetical protein
MSNNTPWKLVATPSGKVPSIIVNDITAKVSVMHLHGKSGHKQ